jgi:hypothetical protein
MGFSFSGIHKELSSERFRKFYQKLRAACPRLLPFPDHTFLIAFFHDTAQDLDEKDRSLFDLITFYREKDRHQDLAPLFIVLFTPPLAGIYRQGKRTCPRMEHDDLIQDICLLLLQVLKEAEITGFKVAGRIVGQVKNRFRSYLNYQIKHDPWDYSPGQRTPHRHTTFEEADVEPGEYGEAFLAIAGSDDSFPDIADAETFMDILVEAGVIAAADRDLIKATSISDLPLKEMTSNPKEYERLKKRRQRALLAIREYLLK